MKRLWALMFIFFLSGCAYIDQNLRVNPQLSIADMNIGKGKKVAVRTIDDRDQQLIGKRGVQYFPGGKISNDQDLAEVLKNALIQGLHKKGFEPVKENESSLVMKGELRSLEYTSSMGLWTGGNIGTAVVKIIATDSSGKTYEKTYRGQSEVRTCFVGSQETNSKVVNDALTEALNKVFEDKELLSFLAQ